MHAGKEIRKTADDLCDAGWEHHLVRARLAVESPAESALASPCPLSWGAAVVLPCGSVSVRHLAPMAAVAGAARGIHRGRSHLDLLLDSPVLCSVPAAQRVLVGGNSGTRAADCRQDRVSQPGVCRGHAAVDPGGVVDV